MLQGDNLQLHIIAEKLVKFRHSIVFWYKVNWKLHITFAASTFPEPD